MISDSDDEPGEEAGEAEQGNSRDEEEEEEEGEEEEEEERGQSAGQCQDGRIKQFKSRIIQKLILTSSLFWKWMSASI